MKNARGALLAVLTALGAAMTLATAAKAADAILSGAITSAALAGTGAPSSATTNALTARIDRVLRMTLSPTAWAPEWS